MFWVSCFDALEVWQISKFYMETTDTGSIERISQCLEKTMAVLVQQTATVM